MQLTTLFNRISAYNVTLEAYAHVFSALPTTCPPIRLPSGGKAVNTAAVPGQTQHEEADHKTEPRSSVSDLVNSLTSEMLMVSVIHNPLALSPHILVKCLM